MKPTYIIASIVVVAAIAGVAAFSSASSPDFDAIITNKDCAAAGKLTDADSEKATTKQRIQIGTLLVSCLGSNLSP